MILIWKHETDDKVERRFSIIVYVYVSFLYGVQWAETVISKDRNIFGYDRKKRRKKENKEKKKEREKEERKEGRKEGRNEDRKKERKNE